MAVTAFAADTVKGFLAVIRLDATAFHLIVPAIKRFAHLRQLGEVAGHSVLDELIRWAASLGTKFL
jgi:hypothetical protein